MISFEMIYGRRCRTPLFWNENGKQKVFLTQHIRRSRETSSNDERELEDCVVKTKEICRP
jgi:hypothetical protein